MSLKSDHIEQAIELLAALARADERITDEFEASLTDFFEGPPPPGDLAATLLHSRRHLEWFLLERHSPGLFGVPAERLLEPWGVRVEKAGVGVEALRSVHESFTGAFLVTGFTEDVCWLRDLAGLGDYALTRTFEVAEGDLLVGRLYPQGEGLHRPSPSLGRFPGTQLVSAIEKDLAEARDSGGSKVLHLSQLELERLFFRPARQEQEERDFVGEARAALLEEGLTSSRIEHLFARLAASPHDVGRLLHGVTGVAGERDALGEILDELAFETGIDLDRARRVLTEAWPELATPKAKKPEGQAAKPAQPAGEPLSEEEARRQALAEFDAGRAAGRDLDALFQNLARDLELGEEELDPDELAPAPDFPGVVSAMIEEFRWELERTEGANAISWAEGLAPLAGFASDIGRFEDLTTSALLRFTTFWLPEHARELSLDGNGTRSMLGALSRFCEWAEEAHEMPLRSEFGETLLRLEESLPRLLDLNRHLAPPPKDDTGELFEVRPGGNGRFSGVRNLDGKSFDAAPEPALADRLRPRDRLRGVIDVEGTLRVYCCYPPEIAELAAE